MPTIRGDAHKQHTRMLDSEIAAWIGLNESIFLEQLNFILTQKDGVGKWADGRKWYRDKPRDFVVTYFPFWDESIVKRTITNLKVDGLILARSDLNQKPKDRSLWYTINYEAVDRLTGPVDRILSKSAKRKEARATRKSKEDNQSDYTKVQNVLSSIDQVIKGVSGQDEAEVQTVPIDESTKCTLELGTNCTDPSVQIVLTPKDSLSKTPLPKETSPNGEAANAEKTRPKKFRPPKSPAFKVYIEKTEYYGVTKEWIDKMTSVVGDLPENLERWGDTITLFTGKGKWKGNVEDMLNWYQNGIPAYYQNGATNGHNRQHDRPLQRTGETLEGEPTYDPGTKELVYPDGRRVAYVS